MTTLVVALTHDIEEEGVGVVVQGLVVQKQLGQQTEVLGVILILPSVNFKERYRVLPVDFIPWWMFKVAL